MGGRGAKPPEKILHMLSEECAKNVRLSLSFKQEDVEEWQSKPDESRHRHPGESHSPKPLQN